MSALDYSPQRITLAFTAASGKHVPNALMPRRARDRAEAPGSDTQC
jgi:hypothetical protein